MADEKDLTNQICHGKIVGVTGAIAMGELGNGKEKMSSYIEYVKSKEPRIWQSLVAAAADGLIYIDEEKDAITATNRLLLTYPDLHEVINYLVGEWKAEEAKGLGKDHIISLIKAQ